MKKKSLLFSTKHGACSFSKPREKYSACSPYRGEHVFDALPLEMQQELGSWISHNHPAKIFLLSRLPHAENVL
jgi:hypothetical protein